MEIYGSHNETQPLNQSHYRDRVFGGTAAVAAAAVVLLNVLAGMSANILGTS